MFKWNKKSSVVKENKTTVAVPIVKKEATLESVQELLTKNLKWSQIIYEQNRKINNKLLWAAIAKWILILMVVIPILLSLWFLPPIVRDLKNKYNGLIGQKNSVETSSGTGGIDQYLKLLPLDPAKQEQLKAILK